MTQAQKACHSLGSSMFLKKFFLGVSCVAVFSLWQSLRIASSPLFETTITDESDIIVAPDVRSEASNVVSASHDIHDNKGKHQDQVVYLSQGPAASYARLSERFQALPNALFFYHSYDQDCRGCIFQANTTLPKGRNLVLKTAYTTLAKSSTLDRVKFFVMMDDDVEIQCIPSRRDCWLEYHLMLLDRRTTWPLLAPKFYVDGDDEPTLYHTCRDDSLWVMRHDHVHFMYPFPTKHDTKTWNIYVQAVWERMKRCFPNGFLTHKGFRNYNPRHGDYPKGLRKRLVLDILNEEYPSLGPWSLQPSSGRAFRCTTAMQNPPEQQHVDPTCAAVTTERFQKWIDGTLDP
jgi:hypothetical protein